MKDRLDDVLNAIRISKKTFQRIKINFGWAFVYNIILVPIAMGILYPISAEAPMTADGHQLGMEEQQQTMAGHEQEQQGKAGFQLDPMWAGFAMALSSVSVVLSSLMLKWFRYLHIQKIANKAKVIYEAEV